MAGYEDVNVADRHDSEELLTPAAAARIAARSVRTIRRAYANGTLLAYRDANGRGVRIRYADLRAWMMREPVAVKGGERSAPAPASVAGAPPARRAGSTLSENLALLQAAREARRRRGRPAGSAGGAGSRGASSRA
jgi:excisionase family DNA binding protein